MVFKTIVILMLAVAYLVLAHGAMKSGDTDLEDRLILAGIAVYLIIMGLLVAFI